MKFAGYQKSSLIDYPGKIAAVLFLPGCNYNCFYCHNRDILRVDAGRIEKDEVTAFLRKRRGLLDGVVVTGGEPTLHEELLLLLAEIRAMDFSVKLDTNGSRPEIIKETLRQKSADYYAVDYKAPARDYRRYCGENADPEQTLETVRLLCQSGADFEVRTTLIPQIGEQELLEIARELPVVPRYTLNRYRLPEHFRPEDESLVRESPRLQFDTAALSSLLKRYQPNLVLQRGW